MLRERRRVKMPVKVNPAIRVRWNMQNVMLNFPVKAGQRQLQMTSHAMFSSLSLTFLCFSHRVLVFVECYSVISVSCACFNQLCGMTSFAYNLKKLPSKIGRAS